ncbi:MAG: isoprenylcysteine carboxylmethyltransferase family protein [Myxococcales bacterium]|jgi:protein-S-isoprenylcysteine O-methyltransferase Ste14|nr:isoprenylcysteine carboxylmethyltransferase family protein [Myxococcales bacterium]
MPIVATLGLLAFLVPTFGVRSWLAYRATGATGFVGVREGAGAIEWIAAAMMVLAYALVPAAVWIGAPVVTHPLVVVLGATLVVLGTAGTFVAQADMRETWRIGVDPHARTRLVTDGWFRWVRNPIFTMMIVVSLGLALCCSTPVALGLPVVLVVALELQVRIAEEPYLLRTHGQAYLEWARRTGRFLPGLGRL